MANRKELERLETRKTNLQNDYMDRAITPHDYHEMKEKVDKELVLGKNKLIDLQQEVSPFKIYIEKEIPMLENLVDFYRKSDGATKKKIPGCFSEKLVLEKGKVATLPFTEPIQLILRISEVLGSSKKKQEVNFDLLCRLVPRTDKSCNLFLSELKSYDCLSVNHLATLTHINRL